MHTHFLILLVLLLATSQSLSYPLLKLSPVLERDAQLSCLPGSILSNDLGDPFLTYQLRLTDFLDWNTSTSSVCVNLTVPMAGITMNTQVKLNSPQGIPVVLGVDYFVNSLLQFTGSKQADTGRSFDIPYFYSVPSSTFPLTANQATQIRNYLILMVIDSGQLANGTTVELTFTITVANVYWPEVNDLTFNYSELWYGSDLSAPLPLSGPSSPQGQSLDQSSAEKASIRLFSFTLDFSPRLTQDFTIIACQNSVGSKCQPQPEIYCSSALDTLSIPAHSSSFTGQYTIGSENLANTDCPASGLVLRVVPLRDNDAIQRMAFTATYSLTFTFPSQEGLSGGDIAGIVVGIVAGVVLLALIGIWVYRSHQRNEYESL